MTKLSPYLFHKKHKNMTVYTPKVRIQAEPEPDQEPNNSKKYLLLVIFCTILGFLAYWKGVDFLVPDADGNPKLAPKREEEYEKRIKRLNEAEQYALLATNSGFYPCFNCENDHTIFLNIGEVWKYGVTIQGQNRRYTASALIKLKLD
jgi:hypothetical protein